MRSRSVTAQGLRLQDPSPLPFKGAQCRPQPTNVPQIALWLQGCVAFSSPSMNKSGLVRSRAGVVHSASAVPWKPAHAYLSRIFFIPATTRNTCLAGAGLLRQRPLHDAAAPSPNSGPSTLVPFTARTQLDRCTPGCYCLLALPELRGQLPAGAAPHSLGSLLKPLVHGTRLPKRPVQPARQRSLGSDAGAGSRPE